MALRHIGDAEVASLTGKLGMKDHLQQQVAEFLGQFGGAAAV